MTATRPTAARKTTDKSSKTPARPVTDVLLELAYLLHATKVVGRRDAPAPRHAAGRAA